jgi:hypothetical protein
MSAIPPKYFGCQVTSTHVDESIDQRISAGSSVEALLCIQRTGLNSVRAEKVRLLEGS